MIDEHNLTSILSAGLAGIRYPAHPRGLYEPVEYTLSSGGKRLRPLLCLAACGACGADPSSALNQALAIEMFHNFTLIHDDVMDRSDTRRGRPTVYARWGQVQAILSGDALLSMATGRAAKCPADKVADVLSLFNSTALSVYEGQQLDMDFEARNDVSVAEYISMITLKTSVLLGCACRMGAMMAGADAGVQQALYDYGVNLGLAFQLRDDWLDTFGDPEVFGKPIGGDIANRKKTWLFITAMSEAPGAMTAALTSDLSRQDLVSRVTDIYKALSLSGRCADLIEKYHDDAVAALVRARLGDDDREWFTTLADRLSGRDK